MARVRAWVFMVPLLAVNALVIVVPALRERSITRSPTGPDRRGQVHRRQRTSA